MIRALFLSLSENETFLYFTLQNAALAVASPPVIDLWLEKWLTKKNHLIISDT